MGTVGLNFGSPTSGAGFDVSATVSAIVANMSNVEKPWKNQLTTLQSQDTVISNLGTLFSNLSTDMSALTNFNGILAEKTGSSSNPNVLTLTSANNSAVAGTHTVTVTSLAQTSSGYLAPITDASDTLAGSITIQVGTKQAETITLDATNNTLAGLAAAINSSNAGVIASVLTDSTGSRLSLVSGISGSGGVLSVASNITDTASGGLGYTPAVSGADAKLTVDGVALTSSSNTVANLIPGVTFQLLSPSAVQSGGGLEQIQVVIGNANTDVENAVNKLVTDYNSLISALNAQDGNTSSGTPEPLFGSPTLSLLQQQLLGGLNISNPNGYLDAITNTSDTLTGSISIQVGSGAAQTVNLPAGGGTLSDLADAINAANVGVTASIVTNSSGSQLKFVSNLVGENGALVVNSSIQDATAGTTLHYNKSGSDINNLMELGISVNSDGSLTLDAATLDSVLNTDYSSVVGFFQNANSWGQSFSSILTNCGSSSSKGILALAAKSNSSIESTLNADIAREESVISIRQASLTAQLNTANAIMQRLPSQLQGVDELYSAITGYNQNQR